jgi:hypothetical protein
VFWVSIGQPPAITDRSDQINRGASKKVTPRTQSADLK